MTTTVWKFPVKPADEVVIDMPRGAHVVHVETQDGVPCLWARVQPTAPMEPRRFRIAGTGHSLDEAVGRHVGTFMLFGGGLVFHVFEVSSEPKATPA